MRVALVTPEIVPVMGGISSYSMSIASEVSKQHELILVCPGKVESTQRELAKVSISLPGRIKIVSTTKSDNSDPAMRTLYHQIGLAKALKIINSEAHPDIYHFSAPHASGLGWLISNQSPSIVTVHSSISQDVSSLRDASSSKAPKRRTDVAKSLLSPFLSYHEGMVLNNTDAIVAVSENLRPILSTRFPRTPLYSIENGVDTEFFIPAEEKPPQNQKKIRVLFVSRLTPSKGIMIALKSCEILVRQGYTNFEFVFVGSGGKPEYQTATRRIGIEKFCRFVGSLDYSAMPNMYRNADLFCCPSFQESFPMSILEAMSTGLPCIATDVGSIPKMVENKKNGVIVEPGDADELANAVRLFMDEPDLLIKYGREGRSRALIRFPLSRMTHELTSVYNRLAGA